MRYHCPRPTGSNQQFNALQRTATPETIQRFYEAAEERRVALGELLKQALAALGPSPVCTIWRAGETCR